MTPARVELASGIELHLVEAGAGLPVILLHGAMGDCTSWAPQSAALAPRYRVIAYSRRHSSPNQNPRSRPHLLDGDIDDLVGLLDHLDAERVHLAGASYGALVALAFALQHAGRVRSLILAEPPLHTWARRTEAGAVLYERFMRDAWTPARRAFDAGDDTAALRLLADGMAGCPVFDSFAAARAAGARRNAGAMKALVHSPDPFPDLPRRAVAALACPLLLMRGEHSGALHQCVMDELALALPSAANVVVAGAGHGLAMDKPEAFNAILLSFLGQPGQPAALQNSACP